ncbi:MAG: hypothetical protein KJ718_01660 [Nanoarchaeota archaeon]|nr:hypothetical protein [Nanoarchaeota archaeon]MBU1051240.1 hypothetical protein [Nanoarchaeota archaeon]MBU1988555.1 hypothetical protein [Nanoarchaeota archaeon]
MSITIQVTNEVVKELVLDLLRQKMYRKQMQENVRRADMLEDSICAEIRELRAVGFSGKELKRYRGHRLRGGQPIPYC